MCAGACACTYIHKVYIIKFLASTTMKKIRFPFKILFQHFEISLKIYHYHITLQFTYFRYRKKTTTSVMSELSYASNSSQ